MVTIEPRVGPKVEVWVEQEPIDAFQRQSALAAFLDDCKDGLGVSHHAYLTVALQSSYLCPFAVETAFPSADYYGQSVALEVALRRQSRYPSDAYVASVP